MRNPNLTFVVNALKATGDTIPEAITNAEDESDRIREEVRKYRNHGYAAMASTWADAVLDGRDPAEDREVFRAVLTNVLLEGGDLEYAALNAVENRAVRAVADVQDDILKRFKKAFDDAGKTLRKSFNILGKTNIDDTTAIFQLGPVAVQAHQDAKEARRIVRVIDNGWTGLNGLTHFAGPNPEYATRWADPDVDTWERVRRSKDGWQMTVEGVTLDLAISRDTINARTERLAREREERAARPAEEDRAARINYLTGGAIK
ncbi:hypothetical protein [Microbacterium oryzae]|nr:hypothetical protein [Microbacterium oryzae]